MIETVKIQGDGYLVNGALLVPKVNGNRHYELVKEFIADGGIVEDEFSQSELDAQIIAAKWEELNNFLSSLTVQRAKTATVEAGFKFSADPESIANISLEIDTMLDTDTRTWYEDWGTATVTKQELQEAKRLASEAKQAKLAELFGV